MRGLISHLRYTYRLLLKSPGFTITSVLVLGFGIGANTAIFSLINGVLLKPLSYLHPDQIVMVFQRFQGSDWYPLDYPDYADFKTGQHTFQDLTAFYNDEFTLTGNGAAERMRGFCVGSSFFRIFGRPFLLGRPFPQGEDQAGAPAVVVLSEKLWRARFHADPKIIGTNLAINGVAKAAMSTSLPFRDWSLNSFGVAGEPDADSGKAPAVGLYAVISYSVAQRTREIGVRTALGATSARILVMVIRNGLGIACAGLVVGDVIALILSRFITGLLYGVAPSDPLTLGVGTIVLGMAAFACDPD